MALPILETASYELTLPSTDVQVKFRPFKVAEEKVLLQALESQEQKQIVEALKNIVSVCTFGNLKPLPASKPHSSSLKVKLYSALTTPLKASVPAACVPLI